MEWTFLGDVHPNHFFIAKYGSKIKNLRELYNSLQRMDDITFNHHVNDFKNDFHNWVRDIHKDDELASNLLESKTKKEMTEHLKKRVAELNSIRKEVKAVEAKSNIVKKTPKKKEKEHIKHVIPHAPPKAIEETAKPELYSQPKIVNEFILGLIVGVIAALILARFVT